MNLSVRFDLKQVPGTLNGGPDDLSQRPHGEGEPEQHEEDDQEELIEPSSQGIQVECGAAQQTKERAYKPIVGFMTDG